ETPTGNTVSSTSFASARTPPLPPSPSICCLGSIVGEAPPLTPLAVGAEHRPGAPLTASTQTVPGVSFLICYRLYSEDWLRT
uniref:Uncharacterized protein n=1 Tax=Oryza meridionalis TaxID=40149 RepID=A0A0E0C3E6_9ORYZ